MKGNAEMKISKELVQFANRAEMVDLVESEYCVGAHMDEKRVYITLYEAGGTRVISMTPQEAWKLGATLSNAASEAYCGSSEEKGSIGRVF
jgi:hypothetical protein